MKLTGFILVAIVVAATLASHEGFVAGGSGSPPLALAALPLHRDGGSASPLAADDEFPSLAGATDWINTPPLKASGLRGKVVLVEFWTYTCVNWRRESPHVRAWAARYKDQGLVVLGVHTPEFAFEKDSGNVRRAVKDIGIDYPVAVDSRQAVWRAFDNAYWPALYFIDAQGRIRGRHFGEGDYDDSERLIQRLLVEAGAPHVGSELVKVDARGTEAAADWTHLKSPESYVGYGRGEHFASPGGIVADKRSIYSAPPLLRLNQWALAGEWTVRENSVVSGKAAARIAYAFHARDVNLVMGPVTAGVPTRFRVLVDDEPPGPSHGVDIDERGVGTVDVPRLYQLVRQPGEITGHRVEIEFLDPGAEVFDFTFG